MMRVLFVVTPVAGHLSPLTPLAWALRDAGHEVLVTGQPDILPTAQAAGLHAATVGEPFRMDEMLLGRLPAGQRLLQSWGRFPALAQAADFARSWADHNRTVLPGYLDLARAFGPDLLVSDVLEFSALIVGGVLGVPVVQHRWGVDPLSEPTRVKAREAHAELCAATGLPGLPDPVTMLDPCPPSLQLPGIAPGTPIRHVHTHGNGTLPDWLRAEWAAAASNPTADRPRRVIVSLGRSTLALNGLPLFRGILRAFADLPGVEAVATVDAERRAELGELPAGVRLVDFTPLHMLLRTADAVVHHGGAGTTMSASYAGLPQLALPQLADMFASAGQLVRAGAGIALETAAEQDDPARISAALTELLADPRYTKAAASLGREMAAMPAPSRVVQDLERMVRDAR
ncbi:nucleotide disphospho-sugar-binding domain-containing protein [Streptomyces sp. NPDC006678]|uniref:nucleotide disphospho-sugar-binding domain-containing protein n=1 Tax=Streptomyces sp. NPDC006678 TaxID=3157185 RepID=UPI0033CC7ABB